MRRPRVAVKDRLHEGGHAIFFGENVDIHHIFPQDWCKRRPKPIPASIYDSIINKTPLSYRTNRIIGGVAPSEYLAKLQVGSPNTPAIPRDKLDSFLASHLLDPALLWADDFERFMADRQAQLLKLIEQATGKTAYAGAIDEEDEDVDDDQDALEAGRTIDAEAPTA